MEGQTVSYWNEPHTLPLMPDVYRIKLPYAPYTAWARWDGERWCAWGTDKGRASLATFSGPERGYAWRTV
jgi:hypothetical protein